MRVLFINPPECAASGLMDLAAFEPLGLELLAASLAPRHETRLLDLVFEKKDVESAIADFKPGMVCMGCFTSQVYAVRELLRRAKRCDPGLVTVVGGYHPTFMPGDFDEPFVDAVGIGPGVPALAELADTLEAGGDLRLVHLQARRELRDALCLLRIQCLQDTNLLRGELRFSAGLRRTVASASCRVLAPFRASCQLLFVSHPAPPASSRGTPSAASAARPPWSAPAPRSACVARRSVSSA